MNISIELIHAVLNYLATRPYLEVADFITKIQAEAKADEAAKAAAQIAQPEELEA
jgi:hypothetical protein